MIKSEQSSATQKTRASRWDKGQPRWTERDFAILQWIAEQYGVRRDMLSVLLARWGQVQTQMPGQVAASTVKDWVQRWRGADVLGSTLVYMGQPSWVWVTRVGLEHLELEYRYWEPRARSLPHLHAINQARLLVEARQPEAEWRSERALRSGQPFTAGQTRSEHYPDAEVLIGTQRVAIEVELHIKSKKRQPAILYQLARRYEGIWYFCPKALEEPLRQSFGQLDESARRKFSLVLLPREQAAPSGQLATPPPPTDAAGRVGGR